MLAITTVAATSLVAGGYYLAPAAAGSLGLTGSKALAFEGALLAAGDYLVIKGTANLMSALNDGGAVAPITATELATTTTFGAVAGPLANKVGTLFSGATRRVLPNVADKLDTFLERWSKPQGFAKPRTVVSEVVDAPSSTRVARELGQAGEDAAQIVKNTKRIDSLSGKASYRIPDELTDEILKEVKNVTKLDFASQIRDSLHFAMMTDRDFILVVRPDTKLSKPLRDAIDNGWIILEFLP